MATIKDVAKMAGVSVSTVSNVLNRKNNIAEETHHRVTAAIDALNYRPNVIARNLKQQRLKLIAVVFPSLEGHYTQIYRGIASVLEPEGYFLVTRTTADDLYTERRLLDELLDLGVSGLLMVPVRPQDPSQYEALERKETAVVFMERQATDLQFISVDFDNQAFINEITLAQLALHGPGKLSLVVGPEGFSSEDCCVAGFREAIEASCKRDGASWSDEEIERSVIRCTLDKVKAFRTLFNAMADMREIPECFIVSNAGVAEALHEALELMDRRAEILTLDGDVWCTASSASGTPRRIGRDALRLGMESANLLLEYMNNKVLFEKKRVRIQSPEKGGSRPTAKRRVPTWKKELRVLLFHCPSTDALMKLTAGHCRQQSRKVSFEVLDYLNLHDELAAQLASDGTKYDVVMVDLPWMNSLIESDQLYDFAPLMNDDRSFLQEYPRHIQDAFFKTRGKIFGLPIVATIQFLFYRRDLFESDELQWRFNRVYGFAMSPPRNWTEFNIVAEFFNRSANSSSPVEWGTAMNGLHPTGIIDEFLPRQWSFNGRIVDHKGNLAIDSVENLHALENLCKSYSIVSPDCTDFWCDDEFRQLVDGKLAMVMGFASHYPILAEEGTDSAHYSNIAIAEIPGRKPMLGGWVLGISKRSDAVEEAYDFIRWATGNEIAVHSLLLGGAMPTTSACDNTLLKLYLPWMSNMRGGYAISGRREVIRNRKNRIIDPYWVDTKLSTELLKAIRGEETPKEALARLEQTISSARESDREAAE